jgi:hypothetical protein
VWLWAVLHERPVSWACREENWPPGLWPGLLPSQPTLSRRLRTAEVLALLERMERCFRRSSRAGPVKWIDGKPLVLGVYAKDPDAAWGRVGRSYAHGYKLHVVYGDGPLPEAWEVEPLNVAEPCVAARLLPLLEPGDGYVLGDKAFDSNPLHAVADRCGKQLVAQRKRPGTGLGHCPHTRGRLRSIALLQTKFGQDLYRTRSVVERKLAWLTSHAGGLVPLPAWVRRRHRVRLWIQAKLLLHAAYTLLYHPPPHAG